MKTKSRRIKTVMCPPYGRLPVRDAVESVRLKLTEEHIRNGRQQDPTRCAIALASKDHAEAFPGGLLGSWTYKTTTLVATSVKKTLRALRYVHGEVLRHGLKGFDGEEDRPLKAGDIIVLKAPTGQHALGATKKNGKRTGAVRQPSRRARLKGFKRGIFLDRVHATAAKREVDGTDAQVIL